MKKSLNNKLSIKEQYQPLDIPNIKLFGTANTALFCNWMARQILINTKHGRNIHRGRVWICKPVYDLADNCENGFSINQIPTAIDMAIKKGILIKDKFNAHKFDQTNWYAFTDYGLELMGLPKINVLNLIQGGK